MVDSNQEYAQDFAVKFEALKLAKRSYIEAHKAFNESLKAFFFH